MAGGIFIVALDIDTVMTYLMFSCLHTSEIAIIPMIRPRCELVFPFSYEDTSSLQAIDQTCPISYQSHLFTPFLQNVQAGKP